MQRTVALVAVSVGLMLTSASPRALRAQSRPLELTYLGNMGVLLQRGNTAIVVVGFHRGGLAEYAAVPPELLSKLESAATPYRALTLALTTHRHLDHFDAHSVAARLLADTAVVYIAATETVDSLYARTTMASRNTRVRAVTPRSGGERAMRIGGVDVTVLDLPHNPTPSLRVTNVGFLLDIDDVCVLHVGDADPAVASYAVHRLATRNVDVAIVPFWYLTGSDGRVRESIGARLWIASHVPPADSANVRRQVASRMPGALVVTSPGERHEVR